MRWTTIAGLLILSAIAYGGTDHKSPQERKVDGLDPFSALPTGPAGGDLSGTYPNPSVSRAAGNLTIVGGVSASSGSFTNGVTASSFTATGTPGFNGDASSLTALPASQLVGAVPTSSVNLSTVTAALVSIAASTTTLGINIAATSASTQTLATAVAASTTTLFSVRASSGVNGDISGFVRAAGVYVSSSVAIGTTTIAATPGLSVYGVVTSSTPTPASITCTAGTGVLIDPSDSQSGSFTAGALATACTVNFAAFHIGIY